MVPSRIVAVLAFLVAGCLGGPGGSNPSPSPPGPTQPIVPDDWALRALPYEDGHRHADPTQHANLSTPNFRVIGWDPLTTNYHGATSGGHYCGDVSLTGQRRLAVVHSFTSDVALVVLDVTDAARPSKLGELVLPQTHVYDAALVPDATYAVLATSPLDTGPDAPPATGWAPEWRDACGHTHRGPEQEAPYAAGIVLVDLRDPKTPTVLDYVPQPLLGAHSVFVTTVDGRPMVLASTTNLVHQVSYFQFFTIDVPAGGRAKLTPYGTFTAQYPDPSGKTALDNGHVDGWIQKHPLTGHWLAYLANWNGGLVVVRLEGPGRITPLGVWNDYDSSRADESTGQIHEALPIEGTWNGKHYTFIGQEIVSKPRDRPTGQVIMLDTTNPAQPKPVSRWTLPVEVPWNAPLLFSTHYLELVNTTLFITLYHGGIWAADATPGTGPEMPTLGVFIPDRIPPKVRAGAANDPAPEVLDILALPSGELVTFDGKGGAYTLAFDRTVPVPVPAAWTKDAWIR